MGDGVAGTLPQAVEAAEVYAARHGGLPMRNAPWRRGNRAPSEGQLRFAKGLGIRDAEQMTKARVADEISIKLATRRLDG